jgi:hypothetical protein
MGIALPAVDPGGGGGDPAQRLDLLGGEQVGDLLEHRR